MFNAKTRRAEGGALRALAGNLVGGASFMRKEPLGFVGGTDNLFQYVGDDPTNATDPLGLAPEPDLKSDYDTYKEALLKDNNRITSLMNGIKEGSINRSWSQQEVLDLYVMFVNPKGSGRSKDELKTGFSELQQLFDTANTTKPESKKDYCVAYRKALEDKIGGFTVIQGKLLVWETGWGLCPEIPVFGLTLGGYVEHEAMWITLPKLDINFTAKFGLDDALVGGISNSSQHIFGAKDIPRSYKPQGTRTWLYEIAVTANRDLDVPAPPPP